MPSGSQDFERLIAEASERPFSGWDFSFISERMRECPLPWDYGQAVRAAFASTRTLLDIGTGGGEFLASLQPLPPQTCATEAYAPNVPIARARLEPLGILVKAVESERHLPFSDSYFDLVINRHETICAKEIARVLVSGGRFITQQVGERNLLELNEWLQGEKIDRPSDHQAALISFRQAGLEIVASREAFTNVVFQDVGAIVYYLKAIPWQVPDFSIENYYDRLRAIHTRIQANGQFVGSSHRYYIEAHKPS